MVVIRRSSAAIEVVVDRVVLGNGGGVTEVDVSPPISDQEREFVRRTDLPLGPSQWEASRHATVEG